MFLIEEDADPYTRVSPNDYATFQSENIDGVTQTSVCTGTDLSVISTPAPPYPEGKLTIEHQHSIIIFYYDGWYFLLLMHMASAFVLDNCCYTCFYSYFLIIVVFFKELS